VYIGGEVVMDMSLDVQEKQVFIKKFEQDIINNDHDSNVVYLKAFLSLIQNSSKINIDISKISEDNLNNTDDVRNLLSEIKEKWVKIATNSDFVTEVKSYKTGQLSKFFGVSQTAINKWIKEGRFIGIERTEENKHIRIPETTKYKNRGGKIFTVKEIVDMYEREIAEQERLLENDHDLNEFDFLVNHCAYYERKYGGEYHRTLGLKPDQELKPEERTDKAAWAYFEKRIANGSRSEEG
jgi:hypothetical protein